MPGLGVRILLILAISLGAESCAPPPGIYHEVKPGQTVSLLSRVYDVDIERIVQANKLANPHRIYVGQRLYLPGVNMPQPVPVPGRHEDRDASRKTPSVATSTTPTKPVANRPVSETSQETSEKTAQAAPASTASAAPASQRSPKPSTSSASSASLQLIWPVKSRIVQSFGKGKGPGKRGLLLAAATGTKVKAAAAGRVIYSGNGLPGYGNLIIIQHNSDYFTIYAYNRENLIQAKEYVSQGQIIAQVGTPPGKSAGRLHFEVRQGKQPVNPKQYLPSS